MQSERDKGKDEESDGPMEKGGRKGRKRREGRNVDPSSNEESDTFHSDRNSFYIVSFFCTETECMYKNCGETCHLLRPCQPSCGWCGGCTSSEGGYLVKLFRMCWYTLFQV